jgi:hypothetical protein
MVRYQNDNGVSVYRTNACTLALPVALWHMPPILGASAIIADGAKASQGGDAVGNGAVNVAVPELSPSARAALVIATSRYDDPAFSKLRSPVRDAEDLAAVLGDPEIGGFTVTTVVNQSDSQVKMAIAQFLEERAPDETVLVYISCHGIQDQAGRLYFATTNTEKARPRASALKSTDLEEELDECRARQQILILDCCFSGAFGDGHKGGPDLEGRLFRPGRGRVVLTASRSYEYSFEGAAIDSVSPAGSVFTTGLVKGLRTGDADADGDGYVAWDEAFAFADRYVQASGFKQTPQQSLKAGEGPKIILARNPSGRLIVPASLPDDLASDLTSRMEHVRIGAVNEVARWLDEPHLDRVLAAEHALLDVAEHDNHRVAAVASAHLERAPSKTTTAHSPKTPEDIAGNNHQLQTEVSPDLIDVSRSRAAQSDGMTVYRPSTSDQRRRQMSVGDFLIAVSGADPEILRFFPRDRAKYIAYGSMISATSVFVGLAIYYALRTAVRESTFISVVIALMLSLLVMALDRWLITTVVHHNNRARALMASVPRLIFGLILSLIISAPMILQVFHSDVDNQLVFMELRQSAAFRSEVSSSAVGTQLSALQKEISQLVSTASNSNGKEKAVAITAANAELPGLEQQLRSLQSEENVLQANSDAAIEQNNGLLAQISALNAAFDYNFALKAASILLFLFFATISLLPIIMKVTLSRGPEGAYDKASNFGDEEALKAAEIIQQLRMRRMVRRENY